MRSDLQPGQPDRFAPAVPVVDLPGIRDFDLAHRRDAVVALVPTGAGDQTSVSAIVDWQTVLPVAR